MPPLDPIRKFNTWFSQARRSGIELAENCALATADRRGRPSVRYVLLKEADASGFTFYTNAESRKGRELDTNPRAALAFYWHENGHQVRIEGKVKQVSDAEADAYWAERPRDSQLASLASRQSKTVADRAALVAELKRLVSKYKGTNVPRPARWTGYQLVPDRIEFWTRREPRLHHRELFTRTRQGWRVAILQP
jgi:pyridoxamine 5'-phosphate oxidase